jgi:hypothetical protein
MVQKVNRHLDPVTIDYAEDVLTLTPAGNATERHMLVAYERRAREVFPDREDLVTFWSEKLSEPEDRIRELLGDVVELKKLMRARLMKHGGVGYAPPEEGSFPSLEEVVEMTLACGAVPSGGWVDGTSEGEADPMAHFSFLRSKGIPTLTVVPDRNWNLENPQERALKVRKLQEALGAAARLEMPILVGTEMNKHGQKFVDTFSAPPLAPHRQTFLAGAHVAWAHTLLKSTAGVGYAGERADEWFGDDDRARNEFFRRVGSAPYPSDGQMERLRQTGPDAAPGSLLEALQ